MIKKQYKHRSGFTLVEVLIAMTLFSMIMLMMFTALNTTSRNWYLTEAKTEKNDERRLIQGFIRKQFEQLVPMLQLSQSDNRVLFQGESNTVTYTSYLPSHHAGAGIYLLNLSVDDNKLVLQHQDISAKINLDKKITLTDKNSRVLLEDIDSIEFEYFGREDNDDTPSWHDRWEINNRLPELIKINIADTDYNIWAEMIIPIHTTVQRGQPQLTVGTNKDSDS